MATAVIKNNKKRNIRVAIALVLALALGIVAILLAQSRSSYEDLKNQQSEMLELLDTRVGEYDEKTIVLQNTTKGEAKALAERFGAGLRITSDGRFATLTLPDDITISDIISDDDNLTCIESLSINWSARISDDEDSYVREPSAPSSWVGDDLYPYQVYLNYLNIDNSWNYYSGWGVTVAVIDTGIDTDHPEFAGRISEYSYNASEDKIVKDYQNADGSLDWSLVEDEQGHGTAVAGTIAAAMDGKGTVGIAPDVEILVIKAECDESGNFLRSSDLVFGLYYAIERDVDVVNMSFGGSENIYTDAARLGRDSDIIMVAAAGNYGTASLMYPAADINVIGVGALAEDSWDIATYSNYGENTDIVAPGSVYTTTMGGNYGNMMGTSFASPIVAGAMALVKCRSDYRYATNDDFIELMYASAYDIGDLGPDYYFGYGAIDIYAMVMGQQGTVTFDYLTDEIDDTEQIFIYHNPLQNIPEPERLYSVFEGWYYDIECTEPLDMYRDAFNVDLTLYAKWINEDDGIPYTYVILDDGTVEIRSYTGHRKYITIPEIIENRLVSSIGDFAFSGETDLREIQLPDSINHIGLSAFEGCSNLISVNIPDGVTEIEENTFKDNIRLSYVEIGENSKLKVVGNFAFSGCQRLRTIDLPKTLERINGSAFYGTLSMTKINVDKSNPLFVSVSGVLFNKSKTTLVAYPAAISSAYRIPDVTRNIGIYAFACSSAPKIDLNAVEVIEVAAFMASNIKSVDIPDSVYLMGNGAFAYCPNLSSVKIGSGITEISDKAFTGTSSLRKIDIPAGIITIGSEAFSFSAISSINFADNSNLVVIGSAAFSASSLYEINIPASVTGIGAMAFANCFSLTKVTIADGSTLQIIGDKAFEKTVSLESIKIPDTVYHIGDYAFNVSSITGEINLSKNLTYLGAGAFASCANITAFEVAEDNATYKDIDGVVYTKDGKTLVAYPTGNESTFYTTVDGVENIGSSAFEGACNLENVNIGEGVTEIMSYAFYGCSRVNNYYLPTTLKSIGEYSFAKNTALYTIYLPDSLTHVGRYAFAGDRNLYAINLSDNSEIDRIGFAAFAGAGIYHFRVPSNVSSIAQYAFEGCDRLSNITFAQNSKLESISAYMFVGAGNLMNIVFEPGSALTSIQAHGFEGMEMLVGIDFGDAKITNIDNYAFRYCSSLREFTLPKTLENIGRYAFYKCTSLEEIIIPTATEHIGAYAFYGSENCNLYFTSEYLPMYLDENWDSGLAGYFTGVINVVTNGDWRYATKTNGNIAIIEYLGDESSIDLSKLDLGGNIDTIGGYAFANSSITSITLPDSLVDIQRYAFAYTANLRNIVIPKNVKYIAASAFMDSGIESVEFKGNSLEVIEQYAFAFTQSLKSVTIPASIRSMGSYVFYESGLQSVKFAEGFSLAEIPESAFASTHISSLVIPDSITRIHASAFRDNLDLKSVTLGAGADLRIDSNAFYNTALTSLYIPENVRYIGEYAFIGLESLKSYQVDKNNPNYTAVNGVLYNKDKTKLIAFPAGIEGSFEIPAYVESIGFGAFENTKLSKVTFAKGINLLTLGWRAFFNAENITEISLPESLISIDYYAFAGCKNLTTVKFAENNKLKGIYEGAFFGCQRLKNIIIPDSIVEISDYAFYGCMSLNSIPISDTSGIKGIYDYAFAYTGIKNLTLPEAVTDIGNYAFRGALLEKVYISNANAKDLMIGIGAFEDCTAIEEITLPFVGQSYDVSDITWFGYIFGAGSYEANSTYVPEGLKTVTILDGATTIPNTAFYNLASIESISVPHSVVNIGYGAFQGTVAEYELTNSITVEASFYGDFSYFGTGIKGSIVIADGMTEIYDNMFMDCALVEKIVIPDTVTYIDNYAFGRCSSLKSVNIPRGVTHIGYGAFYECSSLESINLPDGLDAIYSNVFEDCSSLKSITIPDSVTKIMSSAFFGCTNLKKINIPDGVTDIGTHAFAYCESLLEIVIPDSVESLCETSDPYKGSSLFYYCTSLKRVVLPENITVIPNGMFYGCTSLTDIVIPESVEIISDYAFRECESLKSINIPSGVTEIGDQAFYYCYSLESIDIPGSVESIGNMAFRNCGSMLKVNIREGVRVIEDYAFVECYNLKEVNLPNSITTIREGAFSGCSSVENLTIPKNVEYIGSYAFASCTGMTNATLPSSLKQINDNAFFGCSTLIKVINNSSLVLDFGSNDHGGVAYYAKVIVDKNGNSRYAETDVGDDYYQTDDGFLFKIENGEYILESYVGVEETVTLPKKVNGKDYRIHSLSGVINVIVPEGTTKIDYEAFSGCNTLRSIVLPDGLEEIGSWAFAQCTNLESINLPNSITFIGGGVFDNCNKLKRIDLPNSITEIPYSLFNNCHSLETVTMPDSVTFIGNSAFEYCRSLKEIKLSSNLEWIDNYAFRSCESLEEITLPDTVTRLNPYAFMECSSLEKINIPNSLTNIDLGALNGTKISSITISSTHPAYTLSGGVLYSKDYSNIVCVLYGVTEITIPSQMREIPAYAFKDCSTLEKVTIPNSVKKIGVGAFSGCTSLLEIKIPSSVTVIENQAFANCDSIKTIVIPDSVNTIGYELFASCDSLESAVVGKGLTHLEEYMFSHCQLLTSVSLSNNLKSIGNCVFYGCSSLENIDIPASVSQIGSYVFGECGSLKSIKLPTTITKIENGLFDGCDSLESIDIPDGVTEIGDLAFWRCESMKTINIGKNSKLTKIGQSAFYCVPITTIYIPNSVNKIGQNAFAYSKITKLDISNNHPYFSVKDGVLYNKDFTEIIYGFAPKSYLEIPSTITHIPDYAFLGKNSIVYVKIPDSVVSIGREVFSGCPDIKVVELGKNVQSIDYYSFSGVLYKVINHSSLELTFGSSDYGNIAEWLVCLQDSKGNVTYNSHYADWTFIEKDEFLYEYENDKYILTNYLGKNDTITLPKDINGEEYELYHFRGGSHVIIPDGFTCIDSAAFCQNEGLKSVTIPKSVTWIESNAFLWAYSLENIYFDGVIEYIGYSVFDGTPLYDDPDNWQDGCLYIMNCLVDVDESATNVVVRPDITAYSNQAFENCYLLTDLTIGGFIPNNALGGLTNLETLTLTSDYQGGLIEAFGYSNGAPLTFSKLILKSGCDVRNDYFLYGISGITVMVEDVKESCPWDNDYTGWSNGNKVLYGGDWYYVNYYSADGELIAKHYYSISEVIKPPYIYTHKDGNLMYEFGGWDVDGDGVADGIPATINKNYDLKAVITEKSATYTVNYMDKDGKTVLYSYELSYGSEIPKPANPTKKGYSFIGWSDAPVRVTEDINIYSEWKHNGGGHSYTKTIVAPTCTDDGYTLYSCNICGESYRSDVVKTEGHSYGEWTITKQPTCSEDGMMRRQCKCGEIQEVIAPCEGHNYKIVDRAKSSCDQSGSIKYVCSDCGHELSEGLPTASHKFEKKYASKSWLEWLIELLLNIIFGYEGDQAYYYECSECSYIATTDDDIFTGTAGVMSACDHVLGEWDIIREASCSDGYKTRSCTICHQVMEATVIPATGQHNIVDSITPPTCIDQGYTIHSCTNCDHIVKDSFVDALGHSFTDYVSNGDATYTDDGTLTAKCDNCDERDTIVDIGSALGMAAMFEDMVKESVVNASHPADYDTLCAILESYNALSESEKAAVDSYYTILMDAIDAIENNGGETPDNGGNDKPSGEPDSVVIIILVVVGAALIGTAIFLIYKKTQGGAAVNIATDKDDEPDHEDESEDISE